MEHMHYDFYTALVFTAFFQGGMQIKMAGSLEPAFLFSNVSITL